MIKIRRSELVAGFALSCGIIFASTSFGQIIVRSDVAVAAPQHLGSGPIDMNNLSADILNCQVCRQRLGLPPLPVSTAALGRSDNVIGPKLATPTLPPATSIVPSVAPQAATVRMLGSPGMISSVTADQMALQGVVVEEFKPPQPQPDAIQLSELPPEVRQQFMRSLELPFGARVMSAEIRGQKTGTVKVEGLEAVTSQKIGSNSANPSDQPMVGVQRSLGAAGIEPVLEAAAVDVSNKPNSRRIPPAETALPTPVVPIPASPKQTDLANELVQLKQAKDELQRQLEEQAADLAKKQLVAEEIVAQEKIKAMSLEREHAKERENLKVQLEQTQFEWKKRIEQADAANKEVLMLLEKRTAEVTELQLQLKSQQEALSKAKQEAESKDKPDGKKKAPNKGKKPAKPSIDI